MDTRDFGSAQEGWWVDGVSINQLAYDLTVIPESAPARRGDNLQVARRSGRRNRRKPYDERVQSFVMEVTDTDPLGRSRSIEANLDELKRIWFGDGEVEVVRRLTLPDGRFSTRTGHGEVVDALEVEIERTMTFGRLTVDLLMADPFWYEPTNILAGKSGEFSVFSPGTVRHHNAIVRIHGPATNPVVLDNHTSGSQVTYADSISDGDWVELDSDLFTAKDDEGANVVGGVVRSDVFFVELVPGLNRFELSSGSCDLSFRPAYL